MNLFDQEFLSALWVLSFLINNFQATVLDFYKLATPKLKGDLKVLAANLSSKCGTYDHTVIGSKVKSLNQATEKEKWGLPTFLITANTRCGKRFSVLDQFLTLTIIDGFLLRGNKGSVLCIVGCWATSLASTH